MERRIINLGGGKYIKQVLGDYVKGRKEPSDQNQQNQSESNTDSQSQSPKNYVENLAGEVVEDWF
jgi:uncharacterized FAD-dependent dehydrogenase